MWPKRGLFGFGILSRVVMLLEENNQLLRELHVSLTGRQPETIRRSVSTKPHRIRSAKDVFYVAPETELERLAADLEGRENAATNQGDSEPHETSGLLDPLAGLQVDGMSPIVAPRSGTQESSGD